ncbi:MAG: hypothetical protein R3C13_11290 [Hyphomonas sp.]|uniref:hypothetical protein n=1 Tax=Hyphomonas sp. TaxID=87 RepID=UPI00352774FD
MIARLIASGALAGALLLSGCGKKAGEIEGVSGKDISAKSSVDDLSEAYVNEFDRIATALESIHDEASAKAAAKDIKKSADGLEAMTEVLDGKQNDLIAMQAFARKLPELSATQQRISKEMSRLYSENPELAELVGDEINRLSK